MRPLGAAGLIVAAVLFVLGVVFLLEGRVRRGTRLLDAGAILVLVSLVLAFVFTGIA